MPIRKTADFAYREYVPALGEGERFSEHHMKVRPKDLSRYVLIPGSHLRGRRIAECLDDCELVSATRGYYVYTGYHQGVRLTVCSTGMGGPAAAIAMEELGAMGCDTFLRVGSAGAISPRLGVGDLVVATGSVRGGGTGRAYLPLEFPAVVARIICQHVLSIVRLCRTENIEDRIIRRGAVLSVFVRQGTNMRACPGL